MLAVRAVATAQPILAGLCVGLAAGAKPWALVFLPILLVLPGRARWHAATWAVAAVCAAWLPFVLADPGTLTATAHFTIGTCGRRRCARLASPTRALPSGTARRS